MSDLSRAERRRLRRVWDAVPSVRCKGLCQDSCSTPPIMPLEARHFVGRAQFISDPIGGGRGIVSFANVTDGPARSPIDGSCQFLKDGRCSVYDERPLICRLFGHANLTAGLGLTCPHGCESEREISEESVAMLMNELGT